MTTDPVGGGVHVSSKRDPSGLWAPIDRSVTGASTADTSTVASVASDNRMTPPTVTAQRTR